MEARQSTESIEIGAAKRNARWGMIGTIVLVWLTTLPLGAARLSLSPIRLTALSHKAASRQYTKLARTF